MAQGQYSVDIVTHFTVLAICTPSVHCQKSALLWAEVWLQLDEHQAFE